MENDPFQVHDQKTPWPEEKPLPLATRVVMIQYAHFDFLFALCNLIFLPLLKSYLAGQLELQEKFLMPYFRLLLLGDLAHVGFAVWGWWDVGFWGWSVEKMGRMFLTLTVLLPRLAWVLGFGRYVHERDREKEKMKS
jgi:hypothetical protein